MSGNDYRLIAQVIRTIHSPRLRRVVGEKFIQPLKMNNRDFNPNEFRRIGWE